MARKLRECRCEVREMVERQRQAVEGLPSLKELVERSAQGWKLAALEWEREATSGEGTTGRDGRGDAAGKAETPYGLQVVPESGHLEPDPRERRVLMVILNGIVDDRPLSHVAAELNRAGLTTRAGREWTAASVFELLPRLIETSPDLFASSDWENQRERRQRA